jgi:sulfoxide reductase heme-binding subunit YedZ
MRRNILTLALVAAGAAIFLTARGTLAATPGVGTAPGDHRFWYLARAAGLTAYLLLTLDVILGLVIHTRALDDLIARWQSFDLHQFTALLALGFLALHLLALLGDSYVGFRPWQLLIPFTSPYRPVPVALGVVALYLVLLIVGSFYVRRHIGQRAWRMLHYLSFGGWALALGHGLLAGTDTGTLWGLFLYAGTGFIVVALTIARFQEAAPATPRPAATRKASGGQQQLPSGTGRGAAMGHPPARR